MGCMVISPACMRIEGIWAADAQASSSERRQYRLPLIKSRLGKLRSGSWPQRCRVIPQIPPYRANTALAAILRHGGSEILQKVHARTRVLDQDRGRAMLHGETDDLAAQFRIFEATPVDMEEVGVILVGEPRGACRIVVLTARHHGDVPALHDPGPRGTRGQVVIGPEP